MTWIAFTTDLAARIKSGVIVRIREGVAASSAAQAAVIEAASELISANPPGTDGPAKMQAVLQQLAVVLGVLVPFLPVYWRMLYWLAPSAVVAFYVSRSVIQGLYQALKAKGVVQP